MTERLEFLNDVLVDMDNVLADFDGAVLERLPRHIARAARLNFYIHEDYPEYAEEVHKITHDPDFFYNLPLVDNALEGWQRIVDTGFNPRIASSPYTKNPLSAEGKLYWLGKEFGPSVAERAIIDKAKYKYPGVALIDDKGNVDTNNGQAMWQHVVFDKPHNQNSLAPFRLYHWLDPSLPLHLVDAKEQTIQKLRS